MSLSSIREIFPDIDVSYARILFIRFRNWEAVLNHIFETGRYRAVEVVSGGDGEYEYYEETEDNGEDEWESFDGDESDVDSNESETEVL
jgi:hypothetical protein